MLLSRQLARRAFQRVPRRWAHTPPSISGLNSVTEEDLAHFAQILAPSSILSTLSPSATPSSELEPFNNDWMNKYHGKSTTVLKPRNVQEVSEIVKWCNQRRIGIVPQGGNTGLVGGSVPVRDEVVISLSNMSKIRSFDDVSGALHDPCSWACSLIRLIGILVADAGCILQSLTDYLAPHNHIVPLDLGAKGRCGDIQPPAGLTDILIVVKLEATCPPMLVASGSSVTVPCTALYLDWRLCFPTEPFLTS